MLLPQDTHLLDTCSDVVVRFTAHGQYGHKQKALKALSRRAPGFTPEEYLAVFDLLCGVYDRAAEAIDRHRTVRPEKKSRYSEPEDIDFDACMRELDEIAPGEALGHKGQILNWVIFWHYLK